MEKKMIGILGGMGPEASVYFYHLLVKLAQEKYKAVQDADYPPVVIYNMPLEGFDETGIRDAENVREQLVQGVKKLEEFGVEYIVIACNTVHQFYADMQESVSIPILNIVDATAEEAKRRGYKNVLLLTSEGTNRSGLYKNACEAAGLNPISVGEEDQHNLNKIILRVMAGTQDESDIASAETIIQKLETPADAVLLGCTELPLAIKEEDLDIPVLNSNKIVLEAVLAKVYAEDV